MSVEEVQGEHMRLALIHQQITFRLWEARAREKQLWASRGEPPRGPFPKELIEVIREVKALEQEHSDALKAYKKHRKELLKAVHGEQEHLFDPNTCR